MARRSNNPYLGMVRDAAKQYGMDPSLLAAVIQQESHWNPKARSPVGALGIAQMMPGTAKGMGVNPMDPKSAIYGAAKMLSNAIKNYGSPEYALASYNGGGGAVQHFKNKGGIYYNPKAPHGSWANETGHYVKTIMADKANWDPLFQSAPSQPKPKPAPQIALADTGYGRYRNNWPSRGGYDRPLPPFSGQPSTKSPSPAQVTPSLAPGGGLNSLRHEAQPWLSLIDNTWQDPTDSQQPSQENTQMPFPLLAMLGGAALGAGTSAIQGKNPLGGALLGGLTGGVGGAAGGAAASGASDIAGSLASGAMPALPGAVAGAGGETGKSIFGGAMKDILGQGFGAMQAMKPQQPMGGMVNMPQLPQMGFTPIPQSQFPLRGRGF